MAVEKLTGETLTEHLDFEEIRDSKASRKRPSKPAA
jgi:hypothetical protein